MQAYFRPLAVTMFLQIVSAMLYLAVPVLAPAIAADLGVAGSDVAVFMAVVFLAASPTSLVTGRLIARYGALRTMQVGVALMATGLAIVTGSEYWLLLLGALWVGVGYGPNTPAASHILARVTPPERRGLVFSIKQSGATLGGLIAGLTLPVLALAYGWHWTLLAMIGLAAAAIVLTQGFRRGLDDDRRPGAAISFDKPWAELAMLWRLPALRRLVVGSFTYAGLQMIILGFLVSYLVEALNYTLVTAGLFFATMQVAGFVGRILWGWLADRSRATGRIVGLFGLIGGPSTILLALAAPGWPDWPIVLCCLAFGAAAIGWNGVFLAEVVRVAPEGRAGAATGGVLFFTYAGLVVGPALFALMVHWFGDYRVPFIVTGLVVAAVGLMMQAGARADRK